MVRGQRARPPRRRPVRLGEKLRQIRDGFGLSQNGMLRRLGIQDELTRAEWSGYERGLREPSLLTLLQIARAADVNVEVLIDDDMDIPRRKRAE